MKDELVVRAEDVIVVSSENVKPDDPLEILYYDEQTKAEIVLARGPRKVIEPLWADVKRLQTPERKMFWRKSVWLRMRGAKEEVTVVC